MRCAAYALDDAGDVEHVGGRFATQTEAGAEAERLGHDLRVW